ncbi:MAG: aromatic ring-hydroxylating dioxygenase subunit alpha [Deltaproteobacteria bacterium]|nr:aromatic ring-hydroxylating dioxygenase subunit alpha [Deltaproteobacteria bacterium]MCB9787208.1 aromatic ring-hydroxylating dioxygenase subunit alpha [Deltaproteobacteria bacterium]
MTDLPNVLTAPAAKPNLSVVRIPRAWYIACAAGELRGRPLAVTILGTPLVLFRGTEGRAAALLDRCAHRNVPLSLGKVEGERLQCAYHGWRFDGGGVCRAIPGLCGEAEGRGRRVPAYPVRELDGYVWVWMDPETEPDREPYRLGLDGKPGYATVHRRVVAPGTLHATVENALDVPHTAFLHAGLFRGAGEPNLIEATVRRFPDRVEADYQGEPRPEGLAGRILAPGGGVVRHWDRFILPSISEVEYAIGEDAHILVSAMATPVSDFETVLHAAVCFRLRIPTWLVRAVLTPIALRIFGQDARMLRHQRDTIRRFGGEQYVSTDIDILGGPIWRLLKEAERGELPPADAPPEVLRTVSLRV